MKLTLRDMILIALFAALIGIGAFIQIPSPLVPFTLQFLFVAFAGVILGPKKALISAVLYLIIGLVGVPVFAKGGGITYVFQPTFGYLIGFTLCAFVTGLIVSKSGKTNFFKVLIAVVAGLFTVYLVGVPYMYMIVNLHLGANMSFGAAIAAGFTPFIITDLIQSVVIALVAKELIPILYKSGILKPVV